MTVVEGRTAGSGKTIALMLAHFRYDCRYPIKFVALEGQPDGQFLVFTQGIGRIKSDMIRDSSVARDTRPAAATSA